MKKKTLRLFYSWQDDIDSKLNRSFIKGCLESALSEINRKSEVNEANRPRINLDHDTKGTPGIPDIANTILFKISTADIVVADLTFVSEYRNYSGATKKVSNQNVIFELGFALNVLGPNRIICVFNEAFGKPKDLLFDLQHRRWPILFDLRRSDSIARKSQKPFLIQKLNTAIVSIINSPSINKTTFGLHRPFSSRQHDEFEYLYRKINIPVVIKIRFRERGKYDLETYNILENPWQEKNYSLGFLPSLVSFIALGHSRYVSYEFSEYIDKILNNHGIDFRNRDYDYGRDYNTKELDLILRTLGLISPGEGNFLQKTYKFLHWLEFNGLKETDLSVVEVCQ
ncbi:MAG TPA: hypothetical protein ACFYEH_06355 [Candidatus Brocadiaceae bacterium]